MEQGQLPKGKLKCHYKKRDLRQTKATNPAFAQQLENSKVNENLNVIMELNQQ